MLLKRVRNTEMKVIKELIVIAVKDGSFDLSGVLTYDVFVRVLIGNTLIHNHSKKFVMLVLENRPANPVLFPSVVNIQISISFFQLHLFIVTSLLNKEEVMFHRIIEREDVFYRDEQQGSRDLSTDEKKRILMDLFDANPVLFMGRYYHYLSTDDCQCFDMENPEILLYCNIIKNKVNEKKGITIRNRRYAELLRLKYQTNYFSNEKMREREPKIFDEMVEKTQLRPVVTDVKLSTTLLKAFDENGKYHHSESKCFENFPDSEHFGNLTKHAMCRAYEENSYGGEVVNESSSPPNTDIFIPLSDYEDFTTSVEQKVAQLRDDFVDYMEQRFLKGEDDRFVDYASIDDQSFSREYEKLREQNLEDAYFADD